MRSLVRHLHARRNLFSRRNSLIAVLFVIGVILFFSVYDGVQEHEDLALFDAPFLAWSVSHYNPYIAAVMRVITELSAPVSLSILTLASASLWVWRKKEYWRPVLFVSAMALAYIASAVVKIVTARARPTVTDLLDSHVAISYSFPSGHTLGMAVLLFVLGYFSCVQSPTIRRMGLWATATLVGITLVAFSRIYLGYHWLTDVTASVGLAFIILAIIITVDTYAPWRHRQATSSKVTSGTVQ